jgi:hypothetical protein
VIERTAVTRDTWPAAVVKATLLLVVAFIAIGTALAALLAAEM